MTNPEILRATEQLKPSKETHSDTVDKARNALNEYKNLSQLPEADKKNATMLERRVQIMIAMLAKEPRDALDSLNLDATEVKIVEQLSKKPQEEIKEALRQLIESIQNGREQIRKEADRLRSEYEQNKASWWESLKHGTKNFGKKIIGLAKSGLNAMKNAAVKVASFVHKRPILTVVIVAGVLIGLYAFLNWGVVKKIATDTIGKIIGDEGVKNIGKTIGEKLPVGTGGKNVLPGLGRDTTDTIEAGKKLLKGGEDLFGRPPKIS